MLKQYEAVQNIIQQNTTVEKENYFEWRKNMHDLLKQNMS